MYNVGIDIGSTATKVAVMAGGVLEKTLLCPTGFNSVLVADQVAEQLAEEGYPSSECLFVATGYGREAVPYAHKTVTEISCHSKGAYHLFKKSGVVIDVGGQDTKVIQLDAGRTKKFVMNDKCSAGTGKFLEVMANRLNVTQEELSMLARTGSSVTISSLCTVFAESEVISLIGQGVPREDIARGIVESVVVKVVQLAAQISGDRYFLTGGLCENTYIVERFEALLGTSVYTSPSARFAGAIGAAVHAATLEGGGK